MTLSRLFTQHSWSLVRQLFWTSLVYAYEIFIVTRCVRESWLQNRAQEKREMTSNERKQSVNITTHVVKYDICKLRLMEEKFKMIIEDARYQICVTQLLRITNEKFCLENVVIMISNIIFYNFHET